MDHLLRKRIVILGSERGELSGCKAARSGISAFLLHEHGQRRKVVLLAKKVADESEWPAEHAGLHVDRFAELFVSGAMASLGAFDEMGKHFEGDRYVRREGHTSIVVHLEKTGVYRRAP